MAPTFTPPRTRAARLTVCAALALLASAIAPGPVRAQGEFTELSLTDTLFNTGPNTDFWIASVAPADVDADGDLDLLVAGYYVVYFGSVEHLLTLYRNDGPVPGGSWAFTPVSVDATDLFFGAGDLAWGDYDGDGDPDAVVGGEGSTTLYRNDAGTLLRTSTVLPAYQEESDFLTMDQRSMTWADVDNDGDLDLMLPCVSGEFEGLPAMVLRNDGPATGDAWTFTDTGQPLPVATTAATAWADMDGDGDLDLMLATMGQFEPPTVDLYRNDSGTLARVDSALAVISYGTADLGDADGDGDFDIVVGGNLVRPDETGETVVRILFRNPGGWTPVDVVHEFQSPTEPWLDFEGVTWADYDSDGDIDLLITGQQLGDGEIVGRSEVYANEGGVFTLAGESLPAPNFGNTGGAFTWFDIDGDGDLDYFVAGGYYVPGGNGLIESRAQLFRNDAPGHNAAPSAPTNLQASVGADAVMLSWNASNDDGTPAASLSYELQLTGGGAPRPGLSGSAEAVAGLIPQPGNVSRNTLWTIHGLPTGHYGWTVRAVDNAFSGSPPSQGSFVVGVTSVLPPSLPRLSLALATANPGVGAWRVIVSLDRPQHVSIGVYDVSGHRVALLLDDPLGSGSHEVTFDSHRLPSGLYFIHARAESGSATQRVTLLH